MENAVVAKTVVLSQTFSELLQKNIARQALPTASEDDMAKIDSEIESADNEPIDLQGNPDAIDQDGNLNGEEGVIGTEKDKNGTYSITRVKANV